MYRVPAGFLVACLAGVSNFGFTVAGEAVSFKDLKVYEATPNKDWPALKGKLRK